MKQFVVYAKIGIFTFTLIASNALANTRVTLPRGQVQTVTNDNKSYLCGAPVSKWIPVKKIRGTSYLQISSPNVAHKIACAKAIPRGALKSLSQLPDVKALTKASSTSARAVPGIVLAKAVSGTAPVIPSVPSLDATQLFWRTGVISSINSGSPSPEDCNEFWGGNSDGASSGQTACYMLQDVGQSIGNIIQSGNSLCYFKQVPNSSVFSSGAVEIVRGSLPTGGVTKLFDSPTGNRARIIKIEFPGEGGNGQPRFYIRVAPRTELDSGGNLYKFDLWDCAGNTITSREASVVRLNGDFVSSSAQNDERGIFENTIRGFLTSTGQGISFDTSRNRTISSIYASADDRTSNSNITVTPDNEIISKQRASSSNEISSSYSISTFSGSSVAELRFLSGATKMSFTRGGNASNFSGSSEFRDTFYAAAPNSSYATRVASYNLAGDSFYAGSIAEPTTNFSGLSCSPTVDIELSMDMSHPVMEAIRNDCEGVRLDNFNMCSTSAIGEAAGNFGLYCGR